MSRYCVVNLYCCIDDTCFYFKKSLLCNSSFKYLNLLGRKKSPSFYTGGSKGPARKSRLLIPTYGKTNGLQFWRPIYFFKQNLYFTFSKFSRNLNL